MEGVWGEHGGVGQAVVVVEKEGEGDQRLVAYVVRREGEEGEGRGREGGEGKQEEGGGGEGKRGGGERTTKEELRRYVQRRLPEYMVPGEWVWMERMPLTVNGKVDRKGMPKRGEKGREERGEGREGEGGRGEGGARTATEELVAGVWAQVLKRERVGREENFFELGGHSLLATQVVSRVRSVLGVEVGVRSLFENPTVAGLGKHIEEVRRDGVLRTSFAAEGGEPVERIGEAERVEIPVIDVSGMREEAREEEAREL